MYKFYSSLLIDDDIGLDIVILHRSRLENSFAAYVSIVKQTILMNLK